MTEDSYFAFASAPESTCFVLGSISNSTVIVACSTPNDYESGKGFQLCLINLVIQVTPCCPPASPAETHGLF